ncbi:MAG: transposase [Synergistaceae bacterium]|nr:transposase [Synergistaceae bacterium]MBQ6665596.1 transposase [Synergistaceae bacterium]MBR0184574.1 transposase [Synergistaceae bacterium]
MTEAERLEKNDRIREKGKQTREKRKSQVCRVYLVKIDFSHINEAQKDHDISGYDTKIVTVHSLDKDKNPVLRPSVLRPTVLRPSVTHNLQYISSQMKQSVIQSIKCSLKALSSLKKNNHKVVGLQGFSKSLKIRGAKQFWNITGIELANAKLLSLPDGYYLTITTSDGRKFKVSIGESERLKKCQRLIARRKKGSSNRYRARKLVRKSYLKLGNKKRDSANKITHELLEHEIVYMQDKNLKGWHKGLFGRTVQHSVLGLVKKKLMNSERVIVLLKSMPTTKYCPKCGNLKNDIKLSDRVYECECSYHEDRDVHAARNMILLSRWSTCGTQGTFNPAFGEEVRRRQKCRNADLVELGSPSFYKRG